MAANLKKTEKSGVLVSSTFPTDTEPDLTFVKNTEMIRKLQVLKIYRRNVNTYTENKC